MSAIKKKPAPKRKTQTGARFDEGQKIVVAAACREKNPKRAGAARRFAFYEHCTTVADYIGKVKDRGLALADVRWDAKKGYIRLHKA
jgi:hypothetical protein